MEEIYEKIMREGYGLQLRHGTRTRTGLVCRTDRGLRELKKPRGSTDSLRLAFDVKKRLRENGFANISRCYPTLEGEPFYRQDGTLYILEDVLPQGTLAEDCAETFLQGAETLGEMHAAAKGLASEAAHWEKNRLPQLYAKRRSELAKVRRRNDKRGSYDAIDLLLLQYYEPYMERAAEAEELLCRGGYAEAIARTAQEGGFAIMPTRGRHCGRRRMAGFLWGISINAAQNCHWQTLRHISAAISRKRRGRRQGFLLCWSVTAGIAPFPREI